MTRRQAEQTLSQTVAQVATVVGLDTAISILKIKLMELGEKREAVERLAPEFERVGKLAGQYKLF